MQCKMRASPRTASQTHGQSRGTSSPLAAPMRRLKLCQPTEPALQTFQRSDRSACSVHGGSLCPFMHSILSALVQLWSSPIAPYLDSASSSCAAFWKPLEGAWTTSSCLRTTRRLGLFTLQTFRPPFRCQKCHGNRQMSGRDDTRVLHPPRLCLALSSKPKEPK